MPERAEVDELRLVTGCHGVDGLDCLRYRDSLLARDGGVLDGEPPPREYPIDEDRKAGLVEVLRRPF